jgi:hypothetical protein
VSLTLLDRACLRCGQRLDCTTRGLAPRAMPRPEARAALRAILPQSARLSAFSKRPAHRAYGMALRADHGLTVVSRPTPCS